jgi:hypothetical protein
MVEAELCCRQFKEAYSHYMVEAAVNNKKRKRIQRRAMRIQSRLDTSELLLVMACFASRRRAEA